MISDYSERDKIQIKIADFANTMGETKIEYIMRNFNERLISDGDMWRRGINETYLHHILK
jgi:hypothetical protein